MNLSLALTRKAIKDRWPISDTGRIKAVEELERLFSDPDSRVRVLAIRTLGILDGLNQKERELDIKAAPKVHLHQNLTQEELLVRISEKINELGLENVPKAALPYLKELTDG